MRTEFIVTKTEIGIVCVADLEHFLIEREIYDAFARGLQERKKTFAEYWRDYPAKVDYFKEAISGAFNWARTQEGHDFWTGVDRDWRKFLKEHNVDGAE